MLWTTARVMGWMGILGVVLVASGCSSTYVNFDGPPGTVMMVNDKPYHLPAQVELHRPAGVGDANHYKVSVVFPMQFGKVQAAGNMDVYGYNESDVDKAVGNTCRFDDEQVANLGSGKTLIYKVKTASQQPLLDLTLNKK